MKCLVLGGKGFMGTYLCKALLEHGHSVRIFDRPQQFSVRNKSTDTEIFEGDFLNEHDIDKAMAGCDVVYHLISTTVAKSSNDDPVYDVETNLIGSLNILKAAVQHQIKKIIFTSSGGTVYGASQQIPIREDHPADPICSYGITKLTIEKYLHLYYVLKGLEYCILRISNPYGEFQRANALQGVIEVFVARAVAGVPVEIWGDGNVVRDYLHVSDVSEALVKALNHSGETRIFNISSGEGKSLNEILETLEKILGRPVACNYRDARKFDVPISVLDNTLAHRELDWIPKVSFYEGLARTVRRFETE